VVAQCGALARASGFGKVRYMKARGLKRGFDMTADARAVDALLAAER
jgi:hypothetical protein